MVMLEKKPKKQGIAQKTISFCLCLTALACGLQAQAESTQSADEIGRWLARQGQFSIESSYASNLLVETALEQLGVKYRYGGISPQEGFDCSGLIIYSSQKSLGLSLPRTSREQARLGTAVKRADLRKGDLVFFNTNGRGVSHVGIYMGDNQFLHAPRTGARVRVEDMNIAYWNQRYQGARRLQMATVPADKQDDALN